MLKTDLYSLLANADEIFVDGKKMVGYRFEDEGSDDNDRVIVETEDDCTYCFDNSDEITYGEDTDDGAWVDDEHSGKRLYLIAHTLTRQPVEL